MLDKIHNQKSSGENPDESSLALQLNIFAHKSPAAEALETAIQRPSSITQADRSARRLIADNLMKSGDLGKAAPIYYSLSIEDSSDLESILRLGQCLLEGGELESAIHIYQEILIAEPENETAKKCLTRAKTEFKKIKNRQLKTQATNPSATNAKMNSNQEIISGFDYTNTPATERRPNFYYKQKDPKSAPRVSIITPFFNVGKIFKETARSILRQSMQDFEWIIINDGSSDQLSIELLNEYRNCDCRIRVFDHAVNRGLSAARNTGFKEARTPYVVQLDGDDLLEATTIETWYWHLKSYPEISFVNSFTVGFGDKCYLWKRGFNAGSKFLEENQVAAFAMIRRDVHEAVGGFDEAIRGGLEDWDFWLRCANAGFWGSTVPELQTWYRRRESHTDRWGSLQSDQIDSMKAQFKRKYPRLWEDGFPRAKNLSLPAYSTIKTSDLESSILCKSKRRLLLIIPWMTLGGADKFNLDLLEQLCLKNWEVTVVATVQGDQSWQPQFSKLTPDIFVLPHIVRTVDYPQFVQYIIRSRQIDAVIVSNSEWGYRLLPFIRSTCPGVSLLDYCHMEEESWNNGGYPRAAVAYQDIIDFNIVASNHLKQWMVHRGAKAEKIAVCTINVDISRWDPSAEKRSTMRRLLNLTSDRPIIFFAGRLVAQKQPKVLVETLRQLRDIGVSFTAIIAGSGPFETLLQEFIIKHNLVREIRLLGSQPNEAISRILYAADVFFLPSIHEGIALSIYEAMAAGVAIVSANVGGQAELVTHECGVLVRPVNPQEDTNRYVEVLRDLLQDRDKLKAMGIAARRRIREGYSIEVMGDRMIDLLNQVCDGGSSHLTVSPALGLICATEAIELNRCQFPPPIDMLCSSASMLVQAGESATAVEVLRFARKVAAEDSQKSLVKELDALIDKLVFSLKRTGDSKGGVGLNNPVSNNYSERSVNPLVSVVIPCFNQAHFLPEAVISVIKQSYTNWELIIVNDGSPDNTTLVSTEIIKSNHSKRIRLIEKTNGGLSDARNTGFRAASGDLFLPLDSDDCLDPNYLLRTVRAIQQNSTVGIAFTDIRHFGVRNDSWNTGPFSQGPMCRDNLIPYCSLFRKDVFDSIGGYSTEMGDGYEDWDFWLSAIERGWTAIKIAEPLFLYRKQNGGMLNEANANREKILRRIVERHPSLYGMVGGAQALSYTQNRSASLLKVVYLISSIQGVTGGNQTLLRQVNELAARGHDVSIVTYSSPPFWVELQARIIRVPPDQPLAGYVPRTDVVVATYFTNAVELQNVNAIVKVYYAQGDQYVFEDAEISGQSGSENLDFLRELSRMSYQQSGIRFVANSHNLARVVLGRYGRKADAILPVCTDEHVFYPLSERRSGPPWRILVVGPDTLGSVGEPLTFKGIGDIKKAIQIIGNQRKDFEVVRMSNSRQELFADISCEFHIAPPNAEKTRLYGTAHILIYASHYDSCPRPPQEAMAAGAVVICTDTDGAREYCRDGFNCLLVPVRNPEAIADALIRVLDDMDLRKRLVQGGLSTAAQYPCEREWSEWESLLRRYYRDGLVHAKATSATLVGIQNQRLEGS